MRVRHPIFKEPTVVGDDDSTDEDHAETERIIGDAKQKIDAEDSQVG
jgi:hypothetical protein